MLRRFIRIAALSAASSMLAATPGHCLEPSGGLVIMVQDGDSFVMRTAGGEKIGIRVAGIDAPEKGQPHADESREHLRQLIESQAVCIDVIKIDPFDRKVANVFVGERDVGLAQIEAGLAWHFKRYALEQHSDRRRAYARAESRAREDRIGLWREPDPVAPWKYRLDRKRQSLLATPPLPASAALFHTAPHRRPPRHSNC